MIIIGLTGGIASGKSSAGRILAELGARVVDADAVVHELYATDAILARRIAEAFGPSVLAADDGIDRAALGRIVFDDPEARDRLAAIVWPRALERVLALRDEARAAGERVFVVEAPLLIEAGWSRLVDRVWLVRAPRDAVRSRLIARNRLTSEEADRRIDAQPPDEARLPHADLVIDNDGDEAMLRARVEAAWAALGAA